MHPGIIFSHAMGYGMEEKEGESGTGETKKSESTSTSVYCIFRFFFTTVPPHGCAVSVLSEQLVGVA